MYNIIIYNRNMKPKTFIKRNTNGQWIILCHTVLTLYRSFYTIDAAGSHHSSHRVILAIRLQYYSYGGCILFELWQSIYDKYCSKQFCRKYLVGYSYTLQTTEWYINITVDMFFPVGCCLLWFKTKSLEVCTIFYIRNPRFVNFSISFTRRSLLYR